MSLTGGTDKWVSQGLMSARSTQCSPVSKKIFKHKGRGGGGGDVFLALFFPVEELVFFSLRRKGSLEKLKLNVSTALLLRHLSSCYSLWGCGLFFALLAAEL